MSSEKKGLMCEECGQGPFKSMAGLAGHLQFQHGVKPGKGLAGVEGKQLVEAQEQLGERMTKLEAAVGGVDKIASQAGKLVEAMTKQLPEQLSRALAAHRQQFIEVEGQFAERQKQLAERIAKLEAFLSGMDKIVSQAGKLIEAMSKHLPEQLNKAFTADRERHDKRQQEILEELKDLQGRVPPLHIRAG